MKQKQFKYPLMVKCETVEQMKTLVDKLVTMGYDNSNVSYESFSARGNHVWLKTNFGPENGKLGNGDRTLRDRDSTIIEEYNEDLILALAAVTVDGQFQIGEWCKFDTGVIGQVVVPDSPNYTNCVVLSKDGEMDAYHKNRTRKLTKDQIYERFDQQGVFEVNGTLELKQALFNTLKKEGWLAGNGKDEWIWESPMIPTTTMTKRISCRITGDGRTKKYQLPQDWNAALEAFREFKHPKQSQTIVAGSNNLTFEISASGGIVVKEKRKELPIAQVEAVYAAFTARGLNVAGWNVESTVNRDTRSIRIGCTEENNLFSVNEIEKIIKAYRQVNGKV